MDSKPFVSSGMFFISLLFFYLSTINTVSAQERIIPAHPVSIEQNGSELPASPEGTLHIIAVMVEFQPDSNRFTSGNGTFEPGAVPYLEDPGTNIDALPHNRQYFEAHLEFAARYFERMSAGRLDVQFEVLPETVRLSNQMAHYSPIGEDPELTPLGELVRETWELVAEKGYTYPHLTYTDNVAYVIFHAGIGRDIQLTGTTLDKTPQDIPSVYLSRNALSSLLDNPGFDGFPLGDGNLKADNTLILPRTQSRAGEDLAGAPFVLPLSVNGMITAQIGSHLGLPDLFNTETGESGIGRFGLMDGAGIFAYNGLFPPEMSAWEKAYLGWSTPFDVEHNETNPIYLPAASFREGRSIARISISSNEYFLIENRHRDPEGNGITLSIRQPDGTTVKKTFTNSDTEFIFQESGFDELLPPGVIVDVSNYDFALPGGLDTGEDGIADTDNDRMLNGGILIWHIDEGVIRNKPGRQGINNNPNRRAVNLQEADGAQDIGRPASIGFFQNEVNGSPFDFWWSGNNATVVTQTGEITLYQNRFGPDTTPDNSSNSGAPSFFEIFGFSDNLPVASFQIRPVNPFPELYKATDSRSDLSLSHFTDNSDPYWKRYPLTMVPFQSEGKLHVLIPAGNGFQFYNPVSKELCAPVNTPLPIQQPLVFPGQSLLIISDHPLLSEDQMQVSVSRWDGSEVSPLFSLETESNRGFISTSEPGFIDLDRTPVRVDINNREVITSPDGPVQISETRGGYRSEISSTNLQLTLPEGSENILISEFQDFRRAHTGLIEKRDGRFDFYLLQDGRLKLYTFRDNSVHETTLADSEFIGWPAFADFNKDGNPDIFFIDNSLNQLVALNQNGAFLDFFPVHPPADITFTGTPLIADLNGSGDLELIVAGQDSYSLNLYAYNQTGDLLEGFPLSVGGVSQDSAEPVHPLLIDNYLMAVSHTGDLKAWQFDNLGRIAWGTRYGNQVNNKATGQVFYDHEPQQNFLLLNKDETYNWPNPARDETHLRYQTSEPAELSVKITTMSGRPIYDRTVTSRGGPPEELLIDTSGWSSGGYFALITAKAGNQTERKLVKIAIVK